MIRRSAFSSRPVVRSGLGFLALALVTTSCGDDEALPSNTNAFLDNYAALVSATYADSHAKATALGTAIDTLVVTPTQPNLDAARVSWVDARKVYLQTEAFRFYGGPIDEIDDLVNAWPLNEAHVDYVANTGPGPAVLDTGYVNDTSIAITPESLEAQNLPDGGGESDVAVGWHAIEFLLWGQDGNAAGPGDRPVTDYSSTSNYARRGQAITTLADLLEGHLGDLVVEWSETGAYRAEMTGGVSRAEALRRVVYGLSLFSGGELGGERLAGLNTHEQEDEHSCFSDTTHQDFVYDAIGIENIVLGRYTRVDGTVVSGVGLYDVVHTKDPTLADALRDRVHTSVQLAMALHDPFDQEIATSNVEGNARVSALQASLQAQKLLFDEVGSILHLPNLPEE